MRRCPNESLIPLRVGNVCMEEVLLMVEIIRFGDTHYIIDLLR
jgi:hypothetical protein